MKNISVGILAHVDSGKTTLSEAFLYKSGHIRKLGRVDHKDSYLDNNEIERDRGITIFSKQAQFNIGNTSLALLDTPGHVDFAAETERTLHVLDYAILVISATDGVQSHTETLWRLLESYNLPVFVFVNKMDLTHDTKENILSNISQKLGDGFIDFSSLNNDFYEELSMCDDQILQHYLENGQVSNEFVSNAITCRKVFPCIFGSALKLDGVDEFMNILDKFTLFKKPRKEFGARVYKISEDKSGNRLTYMKITGGSLDVKTLVSGGKDEPWSEKVNEIRLYSGEKYISVPTVEAGTICAVTGLSKTYAGEGLGFEEDSSALTLEPVFSYKVKLLDDVSDATAYMMLKKLSEEETQLNVVWDAAHKEIHMQIMGSVQIEVLTKIIAQRFNMNVEFLQGNIIYKETIDGVVEGVGHYEPLRHYAEVHLIMESAKQGSGLTFSSKCRDDELDVNWQRLILTHLQEKSHRGVLTGSPITDMNITLVSGKAHLKHTDGGDFRQATYRAVRHGLRNAKSVLLEPWYDFKIEVPSENIGRVISDIQQMNGEFSSPELCGEFSILTGSAPVSEISDYQLSIISFTKGRGRIKLTLKGYFPCHNAEEVIETIGYDADSDIENSADSVFCSHGSAVLVKWNEVYDNMHLDSALAPKKQEVYSEFRPSKKFDPLSVSDDELNMIFERTFGKTKSRYVPNDNKKPSAKSNINSNYKAKTKQVYSGPEYVLVDGYNIIHSWESLKSVSKDDLNLAREQLINRLINYKAIAGCELIVVFDAYKVKGNQGSIEYINGISVVYTKEAETADSYIEKVSHKLAKDHLVRVATSDGLEQMIILGNGALRVSAPAFEKEVVSVENAIDDFLNSQRL